MTLLTEKEAAEKWCPLFQAAVAVTGSGVIQVVMNRNGIDGAEDGKAVCIGSRCMAWRWGTPVARNRDSEGEFFFNPAPGPDAKDNLPRGYCGAFGKVES